MNQNSTKRLTSVHPELARRAALIAERLAQQGIHVEVVQALRTYAEQDAIYAQGRTKPGKRVTNARGGQSNHNFGLAVDLCIFENGKPNWQAPYKQWERIGIEAERLGLEWGGRWKSIQDLPHIQLHGLSVAQCRKLYEQGGLPLVWERATALLKVAEAPHVVSAPFVQAVPAAPLPPSVMTRTSSNGPQILGDDGVWRPLEIRSPVPSPAANKPAKTVAKHSLTASVVLVLVSFWQWLLLHWWGVAVGLVMAAMVGAGVGWWRETRETRLG